MGWTTCLISRRRMISSGECAIILFVRAGPGIGPVLLLYRGFVDSGRPVCHNVKKKIIVMEGGTLSDILDITELVPDPRNARVHGERNIGMIRESLSEVGAARSIVIDEDDEILAGNGVIEAAKQAGITRIRVIDSDGDEIIAVRRSGLTDEQKVKLALFDNRTAELATWDVTVLQNTIEAGIDLSAMWSEDEILAMLNEEFPDDEDLSDEANPYTRKIEPPIYEPHDVKPAVSDLFDDRRANVLLQAIEAAEGLTDEERHFLTLAAFRHVELNFARIADYYAHSGRDVQELMEQSALVIIDFNRAIELGFVRMTKRLAERMGEERDGAA